MVVTIAEVAYLLLTTATLLLPTPTLTVSYIYNFRHGCTVPRPRKLKERVVTTVVLERDLLDRARSEAERRGTSLSAMLRQLLERELG